MAAKTLTLLLVGFLACLTIDARVTQIPPEPAGDSIIVESPLSATYVKYFVTDVLHVFSAPVRFHKQDWVITVGAAAVITGSMALADEPVRDFMQRNRSDNTDRVSNLFDRFGMNYPGWIMGGFYIGGLALNNRTAKIVALDGLAVNVISGNLLSPLLKRVVGRHRPFDEEGARKFDFWSDYDSFPSGHVIRAFANAGLIAAHYRQTWIRIVAYGIATMVAYSRLNFDAHWLSDTIASTILGIAIGNGVVKLNAGLRAHNTGR